MYSSQFRIIIILLIALSLRLYGLGSQSIWLDEAYSVHAAQKGPALLLQQIKDSSPPLYYLLLWLWIAVFGISPGAVRLFSVLWGIATVGLLYSFTKRCFGEHPAWIAGLFLAVSPIHVYYSQEARMYTMVTFLGLLTWITAANYKKDSRTQNLLLFCLSALACCYTQNYGLLLTFFIIIYLWLNNERQLDTAFLKPTVIIAIGYLPWLVVLLSQLAKDATPWINPLGIKGIIEGFFYMLFWSWHLPKPFLFKVVSVLSLPFALVVILFSLQQLCDKNKQDVLYMPLMYIAPVPLACILSYFKPLYVPGRYDLLVLPGFAMLLGLGYFRFYEYIQNMRNKPIKWLVWGMMAFSISMIVVGVCYSTYLYHAKFVKSVDNLAAEKVTALAEKNDVILCFGLTVNALEYYLELKYPEKYRQVQEDHLHIWRFPESERGWLPAAAIQGARQFTEEQLAIFKNRLERKKPHRLLCLYNDSVACHRTLLSWLELTHPEFIEIDLPKADNFNQVEKILIFSEKKLHIRH